MAWLDTIQGPTDCILSDLDPNVKVTWDQKVKLGFRE